VWISGSSQPGAPPRPGVYLFLAVTTPSSTSARRATCARGCARTSAPSGSGGGRGRARAVERIEWRVLGSELEAALEELRLIASCGRWANGA